MMTFDANNRGVPVMSVIIPTCNRQPGLRHTLSSVVHQTFPSGAFEVIVVDNTADGSVDADLARAYNARLEREPRPGISAARNAGVRAARAPYVAFIDDDATASAEWVERLAVAWQEADANVACMGGKVVLETEAAMPGWMHTSLLAYLGACDFGREPRDVRAEELLVGVNLSFRRDLLVQWHGFSETVGRRPGTLLSNDEVAMQLHLASAGYSRRYLPDAVVTHHVPADRLRARWFLRRSYWQGISDARLRELDEPPAVARKGMTEYLPYLKPTVANGFCYCMHAARLGGRLREHLSRGAAKEMSVAQRGRERR